jgi:ubiquinone/menaquinone biosynthesis C-methylase UbiE
MAAGRTTTETSAVPYALTARVYDRIYTWKDYDSEARRIHRLIREFGPPHPSRLLDVACGTGAHLERLAKWYDCTGIDISEGMLRIARKKLPHVRFARGRMESFALAERFDAITCLFSAIGYVRSERDLRRTLRRFAAHLRPGGVAIVEPWFTPGAYHPGRIHLGTFGTKSFPIARMNLSGRRGDRSIMDMHHLVGTSSGVRHWVEHHDLGLFTVRAYLAAFRAAGFRPRYLRNGFMKGRGLYVAVLRAA